MQAVQKPLPIWMRKRAAGHARRAKTVAACEADMTKRIGRAPTEQELASILAMTVDKLRQVRGS
jgi:DNA-directed RNA polymerase specialized sigma subunit